MKYEKCSGASLEDCMDGAKPVSNGAQLLYLAHMYYFGHGLGRNHRQVSPLRSLPL